jgi:hypothetical protein
VLLQRTRTLMLHAGLAAILLCAGAFPADAQYRGFGKNKVRYDEFDWQIYHSPHFDVYFDKENEQLLQKVVSFAESAYDQLSREFDFQIQKPTPLIFYPTHSAFEQNNIILNFIPEGVGAFASSARNRMVLPVDLPDPELMELILHELTHIFQYNILFGSNVSRAITVGAPIWFVEGMASYMADDEEEYDRMVLRDAVVNDAIPSVAQGNVQGYFAYRFGHAVFDYIEERWGREGFIDFVYEFRNTLGGRADRALERAFRITPEDFDAEFRKWLRRKYLKQLIETGEPSDFGRPFRVDDEQRTQELSPVASPSGDLVATFSVQRGDIDVVLFDAKTRRQLRNLSSGIQTEYEYLVAQQLTVSRRVGRDLAFSPDGNFLAAFARRNEGRILLLFDVLKGGIVRKIKMDVEQQVGLAWSPDGKKIAFSGNRNGVFDIFLVDLESEAVEQLTNDAIYDGGPAFSPDGKSLVFTSFIGEHGKLVRIDLGSPTDRFQLTTGESHEKDVTYSPDGRRIYFTSDRNGADNIWSLDLTTGELAQHTNVVTGCFMPTTLARTEGREALVFAGLWKGSYKLYLSDLEEAIAPPVVTKPAEEPMKVADVPAFQPSIEVTLDDANKEEYGFGKFFLESADSYIGVDNDQTILGQVYLGFSDYLGDRRINALLSSFDALSNFDITYLDLSKRLQKGVNLFDNRDFLQLVVDANTGRVLDRNGEIRITGLYGFVTYPFNLSTRAEFGLGYIYRKLSRAVLEPGTLDGVRFVSESDDFPFVQTALVRDTAVYSGASPAPVKGSRWRVDGFYGFDTDGGGALTTEISGDFRQYFPVTRRSSVAVRAFAGIRDGEQPTPFLLGGDNIRTFPFRSLPGDRAGFLNVEYRFPLLDAVALPFVTFRGIRGRVFFDVGAAYYEEFGTIRRDPFTRELIVREFDFWNSDTNRLQDGVAVYGWGLTFNLGGLDLNWDWGKRWDGKDTIGDTELSFYIGRTF